MFLDDHGHTEKLKHNHVDIISSRCREIGESIKTHFDP